MPILKPYKLNNSKHSGPIRYGIIGLGKMGSMHLDVLSKMGKNKPPVTVAVLVDSDAKRLKAAKKLAPQAFIAHHYRDVVNKVDAVSVCTPTETHCEVAEFFLENHIPTLVEKPIASNLTEAEKILWTSQGTSTHVHIGHIERFNPAIIKAKEYLKRPIFIEAVRMGPYEPRVHGVGVILDLMIHDLDLILWLLSDLDVQLEDYEGQGLSLISPHEDLVKVRLRFREKNVNHPIIVDLTANRLSRERFRKMRIFQEDSYLSIDLLNRNLKFSRAVVRPITDPKDIVTKSPKLPVINPLQKELEHFIQSVRSKGHHVHPKEAWDALELALRLVHSVERKNLYRQPAVPLA